MTESSPLPKNNTIRHNEQNQRWTLIPDGTGKMHLIDLQSYVEPIEPLFVAENDVRFLLFTRQNPTVGQLITFDLASLQNSNYNPNHPTKFSVHGWLSDVDTFTNTVLIDAFFSIGDFNVSILSRICNQLNLANVNLKKTFKDYCGRLGRWCFFNKLYYISQSSRRSGGVCSSIYRFSSLTPVPAL